MPAQKPYGGPVRKLVLAFDVGTTYSGVAYTVLDPGEVPKIQTVTRCVRKWIVAIQTLTVIRPKLSSAGEWRLQDPLGAAVYTGREGKGSWG